MAYIFGQSSIPKEKTGATPAVVNPTVSSAASTDTQKKKGYVFGQSSQGAAASPITTVQPPAETNGLIQKLGRRVGSVLETTNEAIKGGEKSVTVPEVILAPIGEFAGGIQDIIGTILEDGIKAAVFLTPEIVKKEFRKVPKTIEDSPIGQFGIEIVNNKHSQEGLKMLRKGIDAYHNWADNNPRYAKDLERVVNIATLVPWGKGAKLAEEAAVAGEKSVVGQAVETAVGKTAGGLADVIGESGMKEQKNFLQQLITPIRTAKVNEALAGRTEEVGGLIKRSVITPTKTEDAIIDTLSKIRKITITNSFQQNFNVIKDEATKEWKYLKDALEKSNATYSKSVLKNALDKTVAGLAENPLVVGDPSKTAEMIIAKAGKMINDASNKASDLLQLRKDFDSWVSKVKGDKIYDSKTENAFNVANEAIRDTINTVLDDAAPSVGVKDSFRRSNLLYRAMKVIKPKAGAEADSSWGRMLQEASGILGTKNKVVQAMAAIAGIGGLGAASKFAPGVAMVGVPTMFGYSVYKALKNPAIRLKIADALRALESACLKNKELNSAVGKDLTIVKSALNAVEPDKMPISDIVEKINSGGITVDIPNLMNMGGSNNYAVSIYPELSKTFNRKLFRTDVVDYLLQNKEFFLKKHHTLGAWYDTASGKTYLDVSVLVKDRDAAINLGKQYNQKAITYLKDFSEIATGGTGEPVKGLPSAEERLSNLLKINSIKKRVGK